MNDSDRIGITHSATIDYRIPRGMSYPEELAEVWIDQQSDARLADEEILLASWQRTAAEDLCDTPFTCRCDQRIGRLDVYRDSERASQSYHILLIICKGRTRDYDLGILVEEFIDAELIME